jgi:hypothetical protein
MGTRLRTIKAPKGGVAMTSAVATADQFETQVLEARLAAAKFRAAVRTARIHARSLYFGARTARRMRLFINKLKAANNDGVFDEATDADIAAFTDDLADLYNDVRVNLGLARSAGLHEKPFHRYVFAITEAESERLGDLVETFRLGMNPQFKALVEEAVGRLARTS